MYDDMLSFDAGCTYGQVVRKVLQHIFFMSNCRLLFWLPRSTRFMNNTCSIPRVFMLKFDTNLNRSGDNLMYMSFFINKITIYKILNTLIQSKDEPNRPALLRWRENIIPVAVQTSQSLIQDSVSSGKELQTLRSPWWRWNIYITAPQ